VQSTTPAVLAGTPMALPAHADAWRHLALVRLTGVTGLSGFSGLTTAASGADGADGADGASWLAVCYRLTGRLERLGRDVALLDLDVCTDAEAHEAHEALRALLACLRARGIEARAGIGPSGILAQLALLSAPRQGPLALIAPAQVASLLRTLPLTILPRLLLPGQLAITPAVVGRLEGYGVRTLAQLARLDDDHLRRQFGTRVGATLAAVARGEDLLPLHPTRAPDCLRFRLRLVSPVAPDRLMAGLAPFACAVAGALGQRGLEASTVEIRVHWEDGVLDRRRRTLAQPIADGRTLAETLERLLPLAQHMPAREGTQRLEQTRRRQTQAIEDLWLILSDLSPRSPKQQTFWPQRTKRLAAVTKLAAALTRRHGKPLLLRAERRAPDAIFALDRHWLRPLGGDGPETATRTLDKAPGADRVGSGHAGRSLVRDAPSPPRPHWG